MKIKLGELRRIIREAIKDVQEDSVPPDKWAANTGKPAKEDDLQRLGEDEEDEDEG
jgi:hypothetical protein